MTNFGQCSFCNNFNYLTKGALFGSFGASHLYRCVRFLRMANRFAGHVRLGTDQSQPHADLFRIRDLRLNSMVGPPIPVAHQSCSNSAQPSSISTRRNTILILTLLLICGGLYLFIGPAKTLVSGIAALVAVLYPWLVVTAIVMTAVSFYLYRKHRKKHHEQSGRLRFGSNKHR